MKFATQLSASCQLKMVENVVADAEQVGRTLGLHEDTHYVQSLTSYTVF